MQNTITQTLGGMGNETSRIALSPILLAIGDRLSSQATATAGLVIFGASSPLAKTGATAFQGTAQGVPVTIAASTTLPALVGNITAGSFNVFCFFIDRASVVTVVRGIEGTTLAKVTFPQFPQGKVLVGYLIVTSGSTFIGGTTALDAATVSFVSPIGAFDPTILM
jgi:hypothetical protein